MMIDHTEQLTRMESKLDQVIKVKDDHEGRLRTVERGNWVSGSLSTLASVLMAAVFYKLK